MQFEVTGIDARDVEDRELRFAITMAEARPLYSNSPYRWRPETVQVTFSRRRENSDAWGSWTHYLVARGRRVKRDGTWGAGPVHRENVYSGQPSEWGGLIRFAAQQLGIEVRCPS